jgi:hypothetical protein
VQQLELELRRRRRLGRARGFWGRAFWNLLGWLVNGLVNDLYGKGEETREEVGGISRKRLIFALCVSIVYSYIVVGKN